MEEDSEFLHISLPRTMLVLLSEALYYSIDNKKEFVERMQICDDCIGSLKNLLEGFTDLLSEDAVRSRSFKKKIVVN